MTPYMCTVCGNAFKSIEEARACTHVKPKDKTKDKPKIKEEKPKEI